MKILPIIAAAVCALTAASVAPARAHPHVWVTVSSQVVYDAKGAATGIRQAWKFDDMYSAFALEGLPQKTKGVFTREELKDLAEVNITNLKESDFFTYAKASGKDVAFGNVADYYLDYSNEILTLNFTLPFKTPSQEKNLSIEVYDPSFFVDFSFAEKGAITLVGAPARCAAAIEKPKTASQPGRQIMSDAEAAKMADNWGQSYASRIAVTCP